MVSLSPTPPRRRTLFSLPLTACLLALQAPPLVALGLGDALLESHLGDRLAVTLPVYNAAEAGWPERCAWQLEAGDGALDEPRLRHAERDGRAVLLLTTGATVKEPIVQFTVQLSCGVAYRLARDYTLLLDPPGLARRAATVTGPRSAPATAAPLAAPAAPPPPPPGAAGDYTVRPGDTLSAIVDRHYPPGSDEAGTYRAIVSANPDAFAGGDPDALLAGRRLRLPGAGEVDPPPVPPQAPEVAGELKILSGDEEERHHGLRLSWRLDEARLEAALARAGSRDDGPVKPPRATPTAPPAMTPADHAGELERARAVAAEAADAAARAEAARQAAAAELAGARERLARMETEMTALRAQVTELSAALLQRRAAAPTEPPWWLWLAAGSVLVLLLAALLAWLARRRQPVEDEIPFPDLPPRRTTPAPAPPVTAATSAAAAAVASQAPPPEPPAEAPRGATELPARVSQAEEREEPQDTEQTQELTLEAFELEPRPEHAVDTEFLNLVEPEPGGRGEGTGDARVEDHSHQLSRSVTVRLLEVELHLLYEQFEDAEEVLTELMDGEPADQPDMRPWSMAFGLYRQTDDRGAFDALVERFRRRFNVMPPSWLEDAPLQVDIEERYPHLVTRIAAVWGTGHAGPFLNSLLLDDRGGERQGFELSVAEDISFLRELVAVKEEHEPLWP